MVQKQNEQIGTHMLNVYYFLKPPLIAVDPNRFYRSGERNNDMFTSPKNQWRKHELEPIN
jgi:hypothetical protein